MLKSEYLKTSTPHYREMKSMNAKFTINLKTAKAMGIELSTSALLRADVAATEMTLGELSWKSKAKRSLLPAHRAAWVPQSPKKWHWQAPASFSCSPATKTS